MASKDEALAALDAASKAIATAKTYINSTVAPVPSTPAPVTPIPADANTAAAQLGWGTPSWSDDFSNGLDPAKWQNSPVAGMPGHNQNGRRIASASFVNNGVLTLYGKANGDTGWIRQKLATTYGRWEIRAKSANMVGSGELYHVLALIWPTSERWPQDGEYDFLELFDPDARDAQAFLHYPCDPGDTQQEWEVRAGVRVNDWHNYAFEWSKSGLRGWIDGKEWYSLSGGALGAQGKRPARRNIQAMPQGSLTLQLDCFSKKTMREARYDIDSVKFWPVP